MAFEDDMWEEGFRDEEDYIEYLMDKYDHNDTSMEDYYGYDEYDEEEDLTGYYLFTKEDCKLLDSELSFRNAMDRIFNKDIDEHTDGISIEREDGFCDNYIDKNGDYLSIELEIDEAGYFYDGIAPVLVGSKYYFNKYYGGKWGFINLHGEFVVEPIYDDLTFYKGEIAAFVVDGYIEDTSSGYRLFGGIYGLIDRFGKELIPAQYDQIHILTENLIAANIGGKRDDSLFALGGKWALLTKNGDKLTDFKYSRIYDFLDDEAIFNIGGNSITYTYEDRPIMYGGVWGRLNKEGKEIGIPIPANTVGEFMLALEKSDINIIYKKYNDWRTNYPKEFEIWIGDGKYCDEYKINPETIIEWEKWRQQRGEEDAFIELYKDFIPRAYELIDIDAYSLAFEQFIREERLFKLIRVLPIIDDYPIIRQINKEDAISRNRELYDSYLKKATPKECKKFIENFIEFSLNLRSRDELNEIIELDISKLICIIEWVRNGNLQEWKSWAINHGIWKQYKGFLRNGYASLYQSVFWKKYKGIKYWDCLEYGTSSHPKGYYTTEFRRRLLYNKLKEILDILSP